MTYLASILYIKYVKLTGIIQARIQISLYRITTTRQSMTWYSGTVKVLNCTCYGKRFQNANAIPPNAT